MHPHAGSGPPMGAQRRLRARAQQPPAPLCTPHLLALLLLLLGPPFSVAAEQQRVQGAQEQQYQQQPWRQPAAAAAAAAAATTASAAVMAQLRQAGSSPQPQPITTSSSAPNFMPHVIASRVEAVNAEILERERVMDAAAAVAAELAQQRPWKSPPAPKPPLIQYVDLGSMDWDQVETEHVKFEVPDNRYPRYPGTWMPNPTVIGSCPETNSVRQWGARGDGSNNDMPSLIQADARAEFLFLPPGNYRISSSGTLWKPVVAAAGAFLNVDAGVTLRLGWRPRHWHKDSPLFIGGGRVLLSGKVDEVHPDWFKWPGMSDTDALQRATDACEGYCTIILSRAHFLAGPWYLSERVGVLATYLGQLVGLNSGGQGVVLRQGYYKRPIVFSTVFGFNDFAIAVKGGVKRADIQVGQIMNCGDGVLFAPDWGKGFIRDVHVRHIAATYGVQNSVVFRGKSASHFLKGCLVRGNFIVHGGINSPGQQSAGLVVRGSHAPKLIDTAVIFQAVDPAQFATPSMFAFLQNAAGSAANGLMYKVEAWGGGLAGAGRCIAGKFNDLRFLARMSGGIPSPRHFLDITGSRNFVTIWEVASAGLEYSMSEVPAEGRFNGGKMVLTQVMYVNAPVGGWQPGQEQTFYLYNVFADTARNRIRCIPFRAANTGVVCEKVENRGDQERGRIAVRLRNAAGYAIPGWQATHRFGLQVGP